MAGKFRPCGASSGTFWSGMAGKAWKVKVESGEEGTAGMENAKQKQEVLKMVYKWKSGSKIAGNAQAAGEQFEMLSKSKTGLTPKAVVDANRPEDAPLHKAFDWNDESAAEKYRLHQARNIINCILTVAEKENGEQANTRAYVRITEAESYESLATVLQIAEKRESLLNQAKTDMRIFTNKYNNLKELSRVIEVMQEVI